MQSDQKKSCVAILKSLEKKYAEEYSYFCAHVRDVLSPDEWLEYKKIIDVKDCRDLVSIKDNIDNNRYSSVSQFETDVRLCFTNAIKFNETRYLYVADAATKLLDVGSYVYYLSVYFSILLVISLQM
jgi:hypothetical protein